jgi:hypothetical protein
VWIVLEIGFQKDAFARLPSSPLIAENELSRWVCIPGRKRP